MSERDDRAFEVALRQLAAELPADGGEAHIDDGRLAEAASGAAPLRPEELAHIADCSECAAALAQGGAPEAEAPVAPVVPLRRRIWPVLAVAAALVLAVGLSERFFGAEDAAGLRSRGAEGELSPEVALLATSPEGKQRDLRDGSMLARSDRLGFRYGNPGGRHSYLVIVGWDGETLHWYAPAGLDAAPVALSGGAAARIPFEITLEDHRSGPLTVYAVFDGDPRAVAASLKQGRAPEGPDVRRWQLEIAP